MVPEHYVYGPDDPVDDEADKDTLRMSVDPQDPDLLRRLQCPHKDCETPYYLPNDSGALLTLGTTRLPLKRHDTATILWNFLKCLGQPGDSPLLVAETARLTINTVRDVMLE